MDLLQWPNCLCYIFHIRKYSHFANLHGKILMRKVRKTIVVLSDGVKKHGVCGVWPLVRACCSGCEILVKLKF